jgi:tRNA nucleotidyltransferase (CCA-adding enzyme)
MNQKIWYTFNTVGYKIPPEISQVTDTLKTRGYEAYLVGGCVRDLLLGLNPKDWDVATNATPEGIQGLFEETFYENAYGTVGVVTKSEDPTLKVVEVTPYRRESGYSNARHPDTVEFGTNLEEDLKRRDFTVNAIAFEPNKGQIVDPHKGQSDLKARRLVAVGKPEERFAEDALRMLRAIRLSAELSFAIEPQTAGAIQQNAPKLGLISKERIRDEFIRIIESKEPLMALAIAQKLGLLTYIAPDLERGIGVGQNQAHSFDVWEHNLRTLQHAADKNWPLTVRLAALFHDVAKPETRRFSEEKGDYTFYGHDVVGGRLTRKILSDLRFPKEIVDRVGTLVRWHMFFSDPDQVTLSAVRRMIRNVGGGEAMQLLLNLRVCDRIGTGRPKEQPFRLRKYIAMVEEAQRDPISVQMLAINGTTFMEKLGEKPGPKIGLTLHALLEEVLDDPAKNTGPYLEKRATELLALPLEELKKLGEQGKERRGQEEEQEISKIRQKYWVK